MARLKTFPLSVHVDGRRIVTVGGGEAIAQKLRLLIKTTAAIDVIAPVIDAEVAHIVQNNNLNHIARAVKAEDFTNVVFTVISTGDESEDIRIAGMAKAAGILVNVVDRPHLCDVMTPAIVDRAPVCVAISTEGAAPVLARRIRSHIEAMLSPNLGEFGAFASSLRERVSELIHDGRHRRRFWDALFARLDTGKSTAHNMAEFRREAITLLDHYALIDSKNNHDDATAMSEQGHVSLVGAGPGASDLLTLRAQRALQAADILVFDRLVSDDVLELARRDARRIDVGKAKGQHSATQDEINAILIREAKAGNYVVRLKSGDPMVFGRAGEEIAALKEANISVDIIPGVTSALAAAAETQIPVTLRGVASHLVFATGHMAADAASPDWSELAKTGATIAVYMGKTTSASVADGLINAGLSCKTPVGVIENASRVDARHFYGSLKDLIHFANRDDVAGPTMILIGEALAQGEWSMAEPLRVPSYDFERGTTAKVA